SEAASAESPGAPGEGAQAEQARRENKRSSAPPPPVSRPRLLAAIDRVGGPEAVRQALRPQQDEQGKPLKWAASCCEAARGLKPGDPAYTAWLRLAATPVREVKGLVDDRSPDERRGRRGGGPRRDRPREGAGGGGGGRPPRDGDRGRGRSDRGDRGRGERGGRGPDRASRDDVAAHGRDEAFKPTIRIVTAD